MRVWSDARRTHSSENTLGVFLSLWTNVHGLGLKSKTSEPQRSLECSKTKTQRLLNGLNQNEFVKEFLNTNIQMAVDIVVQ